MRRVLEIVLLLCVAWCLACEKQAEQYEKANMKTRWMEAETTLRSMAMTQTGFKASNLRYATSFDEMDFSMTSSNITYSYFMGNSVIKGNLGPATLPTGLEFSTPTENEFVIWAVANLDGDPEWDVWKIDQAQNIQHVKNDFEGFTPK